MAEAVVSKVVEQDALRGTMLEYLTDGKHFVLLTVNVEERNGESGVATGIESSITDIDVVKAVLQTSLEAVEAIKQG